MQSQGIEGIRVCVFATVAKMHKERQHDGLEVWDGHG
jgi:hypothetical protein